MTAGRLGDAVDLSSASVTALLDRLEKAGHIRRTRDADDRRQVVQEMSDSAMAAGAEHFGGPRRRRATLARHPDHCALIVAMGAGKPLRAHNGGPSRQR